MNNDNTLMDNDNIWLIKLLAFLHDPLNKVENLYKHEEISKKLNETLINDYDNLFIKYKEKINIADRIAAATSRIILSDEKDENIYLDYKETNFIDIFTLEKYPIRFPSKDEIESFFKNLQNIDNYKDLFFILWRFIPDYFKDKIDYNPADTIAPNHSLYDHLVQTSAIASSLKDNNPSFLLVSLSPVQKFIEYSRKTSDLFSSSFLLSYLVFKIMLKAVINNYGPDSIVYPNMLRQPLLDKFIFQKLLEKYKLSEFEKFLKTDIDSLKIANIPNKFLAIVPFDKSIINIINSSFEEELKELADKVEKELKEQNIKTQIIQDFKNYFNLNVILLPMYNFEKQEDIYKHAISDYKKLMKLKESNSDNKENNSDKSDSNLVNLIEKIIQYSFYNSSNKKDEEDKEDKKDKKDKLGNVYPILVILAEKLLNVKKSIKKMDFIELEGKKCNLCGIYKILNLNWERLYKNHLVLDNEKLCGICLTKRIFPKIYSKIIELNDNLELDFPSVSEVSVIYSKVKIFENERKNITLKFIEKIKELSLKLNANFTKSQTVPKLQKEFKDNQLKDLLSIDGQLLIVENISERYLKNEYSFENVDQKIIEEIRGYLREIQKDIKIQKYYAILQMDGDNMGKWLEGEFNPEISNVISEKVLNQLKNDDEIKEILDSKHIMSPSIHALFSRRLTKFALNKVKDIVENNYYGKLVYAGGDDLLALLPVDDVLNCAYDISKAFKDKDILGSKASMSAGILITHYKYPFYLALQKVRELEKEAKNNYLNKKNSFAIGILTHSGSYREFSYTWEFLPNLLKLIEYFKKDQIPSNLPYQYLAFVNSIYDKNSYKNSNKDSNKDKDYDEDFDNLNSIFKTELKRLLYHKKTSESPEVIRFVLDLYEMITKPTMESTMENINKNKNIDKIFYFIDLLIIANKLSNIIVLDNIIKKEELVK